MTPANLPATIAGLEMPKRPELAPEGFGIGGDKVGLDRILVQRIVIGSIFSRLELNTGEAAGLARYLSPGQHLQLILECCAIGSRVEVSPVCSRDDVLALVGAERGA